MSEQQFDVVIVGAGPAGTSCALALKESGLKIAILDKAAFPRDKVCGDAIPSNALKALGSIDKKLVDEFRDRFTQKNLIEGSRLIAPSGNYFDLTFVNNGYAATRYNFDNFLFSLVKRHVNGITIFEDTEVKSIVEQPDEINITTNTGNILTKVIVGCDGAHSVVAKQLAGFKVNKRYYIAAVRSYFKNISLANEQLLELHFLKEFMPGYFWIFPVGQSTYNVGFGMASDQIAKGKIDLKRSFQSIIENQPSIASRFKNAQKLDDTVGFGLPCGGRKLKVSGNRFLLCGDAASLINPATGEGIGNAMISGSLAAQQILRSFKSNDFSSVAFAQYHKELYGKLHKDLRIQHILQKVAGNRSWLINFALNQVSKHEFIRERVRKFF